MKKSYKSKKRIKRERIANQKKRNDLDLRCYTKDDLMNLIKKYYIFDISNIICDYSFEVRFIKYHKFILEVSGGINNVCVYDIYIIIMTFNKKMLIYNFYNGEFLDDKDTIITDNDYGSNCNFIFTYDLNRVHIYFLDHIYDKFKPVLCYKHEFDVILNRCEIRERHNRGRVYNYNYRSKFGSTSNYYLHINNGTILAYKYNIKKYIEKFKNNSHFKIINKNVYFFEKYPTKITKYDPNYNLLAEYYLDIIDYEIISCNGNKFIFKSGQSIIEYKLCVY
jgi:hypothetical protein